MSHIWLCLYIVSNNYAGGEHFRVQWGWRESRILATADLAILQSGATLQKWRSLPYHHPSLALLGMIIYETMLNFWWEHIELFLIMQEDGNLHHFKYKHGYRELRGCEGEFRDSLQLGLKVDQPCHKPYFTYYGRWVQHSCVISKTDFSREVLNCKPKSSSKVIM